MNIKVRQFMKSRDRPGCIAPTLSRLIWIMTLVHFTTLIPEPCPVVELHRHTCAFSTVFRLSAFSRTSSRTPSHGGGGAGVVTVYTWEYQSRFLFVVRWSRPSLRCFPDRFSCQPTVFGTSKYERDRTVTWAKASTRD